MSEYQRYTPEQLEKIEYLRKQNEFGSVYSYVKNKLAGNGITSTRFKVTDRVRVSVESCTIVGYILEVIEGENQTEDIFVVSTPFGIMRNVPYKNMDHRYYEDLSGIIIPEELKAISTQNLLLEIKDRRTGHNHSFIVKGGSWVTPMKEFSDQEIRAELRNRPNYTRNKGEVIKRLKKHLK